MFTKDGWRPRPEWWDCTHSACTVRSRLILKTGHRPRIVPGPAEVLAAAEVIRALHPEHHFPLRAALAWRFGVSIDAIHKALRAGRRLKSETP